MKEDFKLNPKVKKALGKGLPYWIAALVVGLGGFLIIEIVSPTKHVAPKMFELFGIPLTTGVPSILVICIGVAWIFHGVGFTIIRL